MIKKEDKQALERYKEKLRRAAEYNHVNFAETDQQRVARIEKCKRDYQYCFNYYFPHYATAPCADFHLDAADFIKKYRDCVDVEAWFRGAGKSTHLDIGIAFWLWINDEWDVGVLVGKTADDAKTLLSDLQAEFEGNPQIIADFGIQKQLGSWEDGNFVTKKGDAAFFSLGRGQSPRGIRYRNKRPSIFLIDDIDDDEIAENPRRVKKVMRWLFGALYGAGDVKGVRMIFANNLISNTGIIAQVIEKVKGMKRKNARVKIVPALLKNGEPSYPQKYTTQFFLDKQQVMGDYAFQTEYQNNPQMEGKIFLDEQIQWAKIPALDKFECIVGHWDVAYSGTQTGDFNAVKIWGLYEKNFYLIKAFVKQCKMDAALKFMVETEKSYPASVKIHWRYESQFWNDALKMVLSTVRTETGFDLQLVQCDRPVRNKFDRIVSTQPFYQNGRVYYNVAEKFNLDMQIGINQLKAIEPGYKGHDDSPDADEGALSYLNRFIPSNNPLPMLGRRKSSTSAW